MDVSEVIRKIIEELDLKGLEKIIELTEKFDQFELTKENIKVSKEGMEEQLEKLTQKEKKAIDCAYNTVYSFQLKISKNQKTIEEKEKGRTTKFIPRAIERIGIYVPGGLAPLPSSLLMVGATAKAAGVKEMVVCTPPRKEGLNPAIAYLVKKLGITQVYRIGGIQAIWAMANGLDDYFKKVNKICGPGNAYVAEAKKQMFASGKVGVDLIAGPSEVLILADGSANPRYLAADMLAQAEHGPNSPGILITNSEEIALETQKEIEDQLKKLKRGKETAKAIQEYGGIMVVESIDQGLKLANEYASEHLEFFLNKENMEKIKEFPIAGAIFINSGESFADYGMGGSNHVLPTGGTARFSSGLSVLDFLVWQYVDELTKEEQEKLAEKTGVFADVEGLEAHANAARIRKG